MRQTGSCVAASHRRFLISVPFGAVKNGSGSCKSGCLQSLERQPQGETYSTSREAARPPGCHRFWNSASSKRADINCRSTLERQGFWKTAAPLTRCLSHAGVSLRPAWHRTATQSQKRRRRNVCTAPPAAEDLRRVGWNMGQRRPRRSRVDCIRMAPPPPPSVPSCLRGAPESSHSSAAGGGFRRTHLDPLLTMHPSTRGRGVGAVVENPPRLISNAAANTCGFWNEFYAKR